MKFASKKTPFLLLISLFLMMIFTFTTSQARYHSTEIYVMRYCDTNDHKGHKSAKKLGYYLSRQNIPTLYASPDSKVRDTAQIIARETDSDIKYDRQFAEHATKQSYKKPSHKPKDLLKRFLQDELGGRDHSRNDQEYKK